jgi:DeoR family transcriptional regulator, aga operon transcriptional repressor
MATPAVRDTAKTHVALRRERMLALIRERDFVRVAELSERFGISEVTVRSDLGALADRGAVTRIRGGAMLRTLIDRERPFEQVETAFAAEKVAIAKLAAGLIRNGETLLMDVGTTTAAFARALTAREELRDVTVFTNGLKTAMELEVAAPRITVVLLGGTLRWLQHSLVDPMASVVLAQINVHTAVLGCNGVDPVAGITNVNLPEAQVKQRMLKSAARRFVLADGSKIGRVELAHLCPVEAVDMIITGASADRDVVDALRERGCQVRIAPS